MVKRNFSGFLLLEINFIWFLSNLVIFLPQYCLLVYHNARLHSLSGILSILECQALLDDWGHKFSRLSETKLLYS
jgi:hypothetical protein